jgi:hypothetical protein
MSKCLICNGNVRYLHVSNIGKSWLGDIDLQCVDCDFIASINNKQYVVIGRRSYKNEIYVVSDKRENKTTLMKLAAGIFVVSQRPPDTIINQYIEDVSDESLDKLLLLV